MHMYSEDKHSGMNGLRVKLGSFSLFEACWYLAFSLYGLGYMISITKVAVQYPQIANYMNMALQLVALVLLLTKMMVQRYEPQRVIVLILVSIPLFIGAFVSDNYSVIWLVVFAVSAQGVTLRKAAKSGLVTCISVLAITISLALIGVLDNAPFFRGDGTPRYALGFAHPNSLGVCVFQATLCLFIIRFARMRAADYISMIVAGLVCMFICDSRTETLSVVAILFCSVLASAKSINRSRFMYAAACVALFASAAFSFYFMVAYDHTDSIHLALNDILSYRLNYAHHYFTTFPPEFIGNAPGALSSFSKVPLDNSWCKELEVHGLVSVLFILLTSLLVCLKGRKSELAGALPYTMIIFALVSMSETIGLHVFFNVSLIGVGSLVFANPIEAFDDTRPSQRP